MEQNQVGFFREVAEKCWSQGIHVTPLFFKAKYGGKPVAKMVRLNPDNFTQHVNGDLINLAAILGTDSSNLVDVDLDWTEASIIATTLLPKLLPKTVSIGRGNPLVIRHLLFRCAGVKSLQLTAPPSVSGDKCIVELLADGKTLTLPGSTHISGELVKWGTSIDEAQIITVPADQLVTLVKMVAGLALLRRLWPSLKGARHNVMLALAGSFCRSKWPKKAIPLILESFLDADVDEEVLDRLQAVHDTLERAEQGKSFTGIKTLSNYLPSDVLDQLKDWLDIHPCDLDEMQSTPATGTPVFNSVIDAGGDWSGPVEGDWINTAWPELLPFESSTMARQDYPVDCMGPLLGNAVKGLTNMQQVPTALAAQSIWAASAYTVQPYLNVVCDGREYPLSGWWALAAYNGERKTSTDEKVFSRCYERMKDFIRVYNIGLKEWEKSFRKSSKGKGDSDPGPKPRNPVSILRTGTTEGIVATLTRNWPSLILSNSDAGAWLGSYSMRPERITATAAMLSSFWSGSGDSSVKAKDPEPTVCFNRRLSLNVMFQPSVAKELFGNEFLSNQGFLSRFLPAFPQSTQGTRFYALHSRNNEPLEAFYQAQDRYLKTPPDMDMETGELLFKPLPLTKEALLKWITYYDYYEENLVKDYAGIREVANKFPEQLLRLAGIRAAMEGYLEVTIQHIDDAATLVNWYANEWAHISGRLNADVTDRSVAKQVLTWLREKRQKPNKKSTDIFYNGDTFKLRDVYKNGPAGARSADDAARELRELIRRGYVRSVDNLYELRPEADCDD